MRDNRMIVVSGKKRIGKSHETLKQLLYHAYISKADRKNVLIIDTSKEFGDYKVDGVSHNIPLIKTTKEDILRYGNSKKPEVRRIILPDEWEDEQKALGVVDAMKYFRNGILWMDDFNNIFGDSLPNNVARLLTNNAHRGTDIIFTVQSIGRILPKMLQNTEIYRFHDQLDDIEDSKDKLKTNFEIFKIAHLMIKAEAERGNPRFFLYIYKDEGRIKGLYSPKMLTEAIQAYLSLYPRSVNILAKQKTNQGKNKYGYEQALNIKTVELFKKYYGN